MNQSRGDKIMSRARSILDIIRHRQRFKWIFDPVDYAEPGEPEIATRKMSADDWQAFKKRCVSEYGGEKVQDTGMTHSEFLNYIKTSGYRENSEFEGTKQSTRLREILSKMDQDDVA